MNHGQAVDDQEGITAINVVPLVDIVLVLLIIFMVTANFMVRPAIDMELPRADTGDCKERDQFSVLLGNDGSLAFGERAVAWSKLAVELRRAVAEFKGNRRRTLAGKGRRVSDNRLTLLVRKELTMLIQADARVSHGRIIFVIDEARKAGIRKYAFNVDPAAVAGARAQR